MSDTDHCALIEEVRAEHERCEEPGEMCPPICICTCCGGAWPCTAARLADALEEQTTEIGAFKSALDEMIDQRNELLARAETAERRAAESIMDRDLWSERYTRAVMELDHEPCGGTGLLSDDDGDTCYECEGCGGTGYETEALRRVSAAAERRAANRLDENNVMRERLLETDARRCAAARDLAAAQQANRILASNAYESAARAESLARERDDWRRIVDQNLAASAETVAALALELAAAREALVRWGRHLPNCVRERPDSCSCGFGREWTAALAASPQEVG